MVYEEKDYLLEQRRQELLKNIQPGFYRPSDPRDNTIVYVFRKRGVPYMQVLGSENTVELACRNLSRLDTLKPFDVSETIERLERELKWIRVRKTKLKSQIS